MGPPSPMVNGWQSAADVILDAAARASLQLVVGSLGILFVLGGIWWRGRSTEERRLRSGSTYYLRAVRAPRLTGVALQVVAELLGSPLAGLLLSPIFRNNGFTEVLRETELTETPTFEPYWPVSDNEAEVVKTARLPLGQGTVRMRADSASLAATGTQLMQRDSSLDNVTNQRYWQIADFHHVYTRGAITPVDVLRNIIDILKETQTVEPKMHLLLYRDDNDMMKQAAASRERYQKKQSRSTLDGVPFAVIDAIDAIPYPTSAGTSWDYRRIKAEAPCIAALKEAGAILIGKTNMHEAGVGMTGINKHHGAVRNPHNLAHMAGGSSSGSAAIVAAGICPFAIGIDGGGSLRVPAALCGVVGLRPTVGRTSTLGCSPNAFSIMGYGPISGTVADALIVHAVIANAGEGHIIGPLACRMPIGINSINLARQPAAVMIPHRLFSAQGSREITKLPNLKVGIFWDWFGDAAPDVVTACRQAVASLQTELGCQVHAIEFPELEMARVAQTAAVGAELAEAYKHFLAKRKLSKYLAPDTRATLLVASAFTATDFLQAQKVRTRVMNRFAELFHSVDVILTPTVPITAPVIRKDALRCGELDMRLASQLMRFTNAVNMAGLPAISVPVGHDASGGLPIGLQVIGRAWQEASLLYIGSALEAILETSRRMPTVMYNVMVGRRKDD